MIFHLIQYLEGLGADFPGMGLINFLSFRAMAAAGELATSIRRICACIAWHRYAVSCSLSVGTCTGRKFPVPESALDRASDKSWF